MKPAWDKLMAEYENHASILVADADCTAEGKSLCDEVGVQGFPTIKYGDPSDLLVYEGGRGYDELAAFAKTSLGPQCGPNNVDLCDDETRKTIERFTEMSDDDLSVQIEYGEAAIKRAEDDLETLLKDLQQQYETAIKAKDEKKKEVKESGLGLAKAVLAYRTKTKVEL
eukprot:TRINITY_DN4776_c0_g1_i1.p1 TRINITY_DN4776_c0_g1~~TRINITY_DN4776_c0_g1_i1.p1  ORF type:complete len:169 (+),score=45.06 TRINITY_DN4776_c0_g1_i1:223-729(+)